MTPHFVTVVTQEEQGGEAVTVSAPGIVSGAQTIAFLPSGTVSHVNVPLFATEEEALLQLPMYRVVSWDDDSPSVSANKAVEGEPHE